MSKIQCIATLSDTLISLLHFTFIFFSVFLSNVFKRFRVVAKSAYELRHVRRMLVHICQRVSHWTNFFETWYWRLLLKCVDEPQIWLQSDKSFGHFALRPQYVLLLPATYIRHASIVVQHNIFLLLAVICSLTIHAERIVSFRLQQWLCGHSSVLAYTYFTYLLVQFILLHARTPLKGVCHLYLSIIVYWWQ